MNILNMESALRSEEKIAVLKELYKEEQVEEAVKKYCYIGSCYEENFGSSEFEFFSAPGRTEICGNHTDHNGGRVLAASIQMDCIAAAGRNDMQKAVIISETYHQTIELDLGNLEPAEGDTASRALLKGLMTGFVKNGCHIGGFYAYTTSSVISAAGLSSSASFEMLICSILNHLFNQDKINTTMLAQIGQFSENIYWNKQSGLLDQIACAFGGLISIDFSQNPPSIQQIDFSFEAMGYDLIIVNTGKGHGDLSSEYSSIPDEMKAVAAYFGKDVLKDVSLGDILNNFTPLRQKLGDRAFLRAFHFYNETMRVEACVEALANKNYDSFLDIIRRSGKSSFECLQNCYCHDQIREQSIPVTLALTEEFLDRIGHGVCRVHGGGFAGVIMAALPKEFTQEYTSFIESFLGEGSVYPLHIRKYGAICL